MNSTTTTKMVVAGEKTTEMPKKATEPKASRRYRWREGDCLATYGISANKWREFSSTDEFAEAF
jgi:hypothetical protein